MPRESVPTTPKPAQSPSCAAVISFLVLVSFFFSKKKSNFFLVGVQWALDHISHSKTLGINLDSPLVLSNRVFRLDHSPQLQCRAYLLLVLPRLAQGLLHELFHVWFALRVAIAQGPIWIPSSSGSLDREGLQSGCNSKYASSKNPQYLRKLVFSFC